MICKSCGAHKEEIPGCSPLTIGVQLPLIYECLLSFYSIKYFIHDMHI